MSLALPSLHALQVLYSEDSTSRDDWLLAISDTALVLSGANAPMVVADRYQVGVFDNGGGRESSQGGRLQQWLRTLALWMRVCRCHAGE